MSHIFPEMHFILTEIRHCVTSLNSIISRNFISINVELMMRSINSLLSETETTQLLPISIPE